MDGLLEIGKGSWQKYETAGHVPGGNVLRRLMKRGFNTNWILSGEGEMLLPANHAVNQPTDNPLVNNTLKRIESATTALGRIFEEEQLEPTGRWLIYLQELMVVHKLTDEGAQRLLQILKTKEPLPPHESGD
jgi:hypothetical protein